MFYRSNNLDVLVKAYIVYWILDNMNKQLVIYLLQVQGRRPSKYTMKKVTHLHLYSIVLKIQSVQMKDLVIQF
ncbi:unnamed protein product [Rhizophagus irregularis]|uniref:Uncharacterized protein n=1 Tax=Rhizophagus irregularis TaxID=588596 RepID=A0A915YSP2_9GLOM|nr:unnamed protein product [Rhizophagus irregularis]CAB4478137.1 unnamed protein product [Rhizophagus irregularis]CAB5180089.1 unnamed protein product [Rhizophagus irregularis]CAB5324873.1 unnamed protein product [Rhizophagus irregularis]